MVARTIVALGLFSEEWSTIRSPPNVRPYRLTIPILIPHSSQKAIWSASSFFSNPSLRIRFAFTSGTLPFRSVEFFFFAHYPMFAGRLADGSLGDIQLKRFLCLPDCEVRMFLNQGIDCFHFLLCQLGLAAAQIHTQVSSFGSRSSNRGE